MTSQLRPRNWRLATRVVFAAFALLAILLVIVVLTYGQAARERRAAEIDNAVSTGLAVAGIIDGFARDLEATMLATSLLLGGMTGPIDQEAAGIHLRTVAEEYGMLRGYFVTDPAGTVIASQSGEGIGIDLSTRPYMQALRAGAPVVWGEGVAGIQTGEVTLTFGRAIQAPDGSLRGYLVAAFYPPRLAERLAGRIPGDADVTVFDRNGLVLYSTARPDLPLEARDASDSVRVQSALRGNVERVEDQTVFFGEDARFGVVAPVPTAQWAVAFTRPLAPLEATLREQYLLQAAQVSIAVLVGGLLLALATRRITRPLGDLARAATAVARGDRPDIPPVDGHAEIGELSAAMSAMSDAVAQRENALRQEVERRTLLAEASRAFAEAGLVLDDQLDAIGRRVSGSVRDGCVIRLLSADGTSLTAVSLHHPSDEARSLAREVLGGEPLRVDEGIPGRVVQTGEPVLMPVVSREEMLSFLPPAHHAFFERYTMHTVASVPLRARGRMLGSLTVWRDLTPEPYTADDLQLLQDIANRAALAIENARLFREAHEYAEAVERSMRAHDEFLALVSHDLRNPLATIKATAQLLLRRAERGEFDRDQICEAMEGIVISVDRATYDIDESLDFARSQMGHPLTLAPTPLDLVALLTDLAAKHQQSTDRHTITVEAPDGAIHGSWDQRRLERAFENLLGNAIKFSPEGGTVTVRAFRSDDEAGDQADVEVSDHGMGIPAEGLSRIFDRFYRAENVADQIPGTGLGLSGVRYIVEAHGGSVAVQSHEGKGSVFTVRLPLVTPVEPVDPVGEALPAPAAEDFIGQAQPGLAAEDAVVPDR